MIIIFLGNTIEFFLKNHFKKLEASCFRIGIPFHILFLAPPPVSAKLHFINRWTDDYFSEQFRLDHFIFSRSLTFCQVHFQFRTKHGPINSHRHLAQHCGVYSTHKFQSVRIFETRASARYSRTINLRHLHRTTRMPITKGSYKDE